MRKSSLASVVISVFVLVLVSTLPAYAQADPGYKIGDRVEADGESMSHFRKATVIGMVRNGYVVLYDGPFPRSGSVVNYSPTALRRLNEKHIDVPPGCPAMGQSQAEMEAVATCWDAAARRPAQPNVQPPHDVAARPPAVPAKTRAKTAAEYEAEAAAYEAEAARLLAKNGQHPPAQPRTVAQNSGKPSAAGAVPVDPKVPARVAPGRYECWFGAGGNQNYSYMDVNILSASTYRDKNGAPGNYSYNPATQLITFQSGPLARQYSKYLPGTSGYRIGLASQPTTFFNMVCDPKG